MNVKEIVKNNTASFRNYRQGHAYYEVIVPEKGPFYFPVDLSDVGDATLMREEKAIFLMRYIRKAIEQGTFIPCVKD